MANITSASFNTDVFPPEVVGQIINTALEGAPIFDSLTRRTTGRGSLVFPTGDPSGFDWIGELGEIPAVDPGDDSAVVSVAKIAGQLLLSNESVADQELNLTSEVGRLVRESMAAKADTDLTYGTGPAPEPVGFLPGLTPVVNTTLRGAVIDACSEILAAGGTPTTVLLSPAQWAAEMRRREETYTAGGALFADLGIPLQVKVAHTLEADDGLVLDKAGCFGIVRSDYSIEASSEGGSAWSHDGISLRIKARLAVAIPAPDKHIRAVATISSSG